MTVRHLLGQTSGLRDYYSIDRNRDGVGDIIQAIIADPRRHWDPLALVEDTIRYARPHAPPGQAFLYGDTNYVLLGLVVEAATGEPLPRVYRKRIFDPLAMTDTYLQWYEAETAGAPLAYAYMNVFSNVHELAPFVDTASWAGSGIVSSTRDLARFGRALFEGAVFRDPMTLGEMRRWSSLGNDRYGLGLMRLFPAGAELWGHTGQWGSFLFYWPQRRAVICGTFNDSRADVETFLGEVVRIVEEEI